jgi:multidrug efflux pump
VISRYFIDRPIFATVISVAITLAGCIALAYLPVAQYPRITPPGIVISISYPGASAQEVADTVGAPIEQQVNGVEGMLYMSSQSGNDGTYSLTVTFDIGTDLNSALVKVQNRVALCMPLLPSPVQNQGITVRKKTPDLLLMISFYSPDGRYDDKYLSNFATIGVKDELLRVEGVSDINIQGLRDYSMRAWLDPRKLASRNLTAGDVAAAIRSQNVDAPAGRIGQPPVANGQAFQYPLDTLGRLNDPTQFGDLIVKVGGSPQVLSPTGKWMIPTATGGGMGLPGSTVVGSMTTSSSDSTSAATILPTLSDPTAQGGSTVPSASGPTGGSPDGLTATPDFTTSSQATGGATTPDPLAPPGGSGIPTSGETAGGTVGAFSLNGGALSGDSTFPSSPLVRLRDVARIELGAQNYNSVCRFDGLPSVGLGIYQLPGTNALEVGDRIRAKMQELKASFPDGIEYQIAYDTTPYVRESVNDVVRTLLEAVGLVALVVLVFLQSWRAAIIPLCAVPVAVTGTFAVMAALGYSLNNISLFGLVLAIGIVVDDAIVVVENCERWLELGVPAKEAAQKAMDEVTGPVIAVALVLSAVFVPCAFITGITGQFFRQFAVTIAVSTAFSALNSLTLSPALAAILLRHKGGHRDVLTWLLDHTLGWFFWLFNKGFEAGTAAYAWVIGRFLRLTAVVLLVYAGLLVLTGWTFRQAATGFIPQQDQGRLIVNIQLPDAASMERTQDALAEVDRIARETPGVAHTVSIAGMSFLLQANSPNFASMFVVLDPFDKRQAPHLADTAIMTKLRKAWGERVKDATVTVFGAAPVPGLGVAGGFKFVVQDRGGLGVPALAARMDELVGALKKLPTLNSATTQFRPKNPQIYLDIDRAKCASLGVSLNDVNETLDMYLGSLYVNSYNEFGRHWQVTIQAEGEFRSRPEEIASFQVRNSAGGMVPLGTLVKVKRIGGPISVTRYNLYTAAAVNGNVQPGSSSGEAIAGINETSDRMLPLSMSIAWTDLMFMQIRAGNTALYVFILSVISVFLALSALYESWALPLAVILVVPLCMLCSAAGVLFTGRDVNIFVQIGLVVLVGLACKNAILVVEFAKQLHTAGQSRYDATVRASRLRLRPILMTSFAFVFGVLPLCFASGAGAEMRRSLGVAVFSGMLGVTLFGIFLTPVFFCVIQGLSETPFFKNPDVRSVGSYGLGGGLGAAVGFSLARLDVGVMPWNAVGGAAAGLVVVWITRAWTERNRQSLPSLLTRLRTRMTGGGANR